MGINWIKVLGDRLLVRDTDGTNTHCIPNGSGMFVPVTQGDTAQSGGSGTAGDGIQITAAMITAAVTSVGGSTSSMVDTAQHIADSFNAAIAATYPGLLSSKNRAACLVGECAQETDWYKTTTEYSAGHNSYSPYDGRGFIQLTWQSNYLAFGQWLNKMGKLTQPDYFVSNPTALADLEWAPYTAIYYFTQNTWSGQNLMQLCDSASSPWSNISRAINRGSPTSTSPAYGETDRATAINAVLAITPNPVPPAASQSANAKQNQIVNWIKSKENAYHYGQGPGRLEPDTSGYTDCSGLMYWGFKSQLGQMIGTWTGDQIHYGTKITEGSGAVPESQLQLGDLIFCDNANYTASFDHVVMYVGNHTVFSHGGPGDGPDPRTLPDYFTNGYWNRWQVRRYL